MQEAVPANEGSMLAVLGSQLSVVEKLIKENVKDCFIANNNSPQQVVVSGLKKDIDLFSEILNKSKIKNLLVSQIEGRVKWLESVKFMIDKGTKNFIEIGPGKVLSGLIKRIDKNVRINSINNIIDIKEIKLNE